jgi:hypothetical protein
VYLITPSPTFSSLSLSVLKELMNMELLVECELAEETEVLGENLLHYHFAHHKSYMT